jgi:hypothetical protein
MGIPWMNPDGLFQKFGVDEGVNTQAGEVPTAGIHRLTEFRIDLTKVPLASNVILADTTLLPKNARLEEVEVEVEAAAAGGTAVLNVGLIATDRVTVDSAVGLVSGATQAQLSPTGARLNLITAAPRGDRIGTSLAGPRLVTAGATTAVFTAGVLKLRVKYYFI